MTLAVLAIYGRTIHFEYTTWDDGAYIAKNHLLGPLSWQQVKLQFTRFEVGNYHPVTMLSYCLDLSIAGRDPAWTHGMNAFIHLLNGFLVFAFLHQLTGRATLSSIAAVLFAVHPTHVESVAWVSGRKDVLFVLFGLLSLTAYVRFLRKKAHGWLALSFLFFLLSCLSKAMAASLVPTFVLMDLYAGRSLRSARMWVEKLPFSIAAIVVGAVAVQAQASAQALGDFARYGPVERTVMAAANVMIYLAQQFVPAGLNAFYGYPAVAGLPAVFMLMALAFATLCYLMYRYRRYRDLLFAFLFFLVNIALVLQVVPVGIAVRADRYTYMGGIGWAFGAAWLWQAARDRWSWIRQLLTWSMPLYVCALAGAAFLQTAVWRDSITLWDHILERNPRLAVGFNNRGIAYLDRREYDKAREDLQMALKIDPKYPLAYSNMGLVFLRQENYPEAVKMFNEALKITWDIPVIIDHMAYTLIQMQQYAVAKDYCRWSLERDPLNIEAYNNLANCHYALDQLDSARIDIERSLGIAAANPEALYLRGLVRIKQGEVEAACADLNAARDGRVPGLEFVLLESMLREHCP